jgi:hypothetical protein
MHKEEQYWQIDRSIDLGMGLQITISIDLGMGLEMAMSCNHF